MCGSVEISGVELREGNFRFFLLPSPKTISLAYYQQLI